MWSIDIKKVFQVKDVTSWCDVGILFHIILPPSFYIRRSFKKSLKETLKSAKEDCVLRCEGYIFKRYLGYIMQSFLPYTNSAFY